MYDICCVGHITLDKVVTPQSVAYMAGGTSFYFSNAVRNLDLNYALVTALGEEEKYFINDLRNIGIEVTALSSKHTVCFENIYPKNQDHRVQKVSQKADPFTVEQLQPVNARYFHLGPLLADDMPADLISTLAARGKVSLDVQGFLRELRHEQVYAVDWGAKKEALPYVHTLKANESEMEVLTGQKEIRRGAEILADWGVKEVVITLGSLGSVIYRDGNFSEIPAYQPAAVTDATGCGDTYMAGYLYQRIKGASIQDAGEFAAAMATLKINTSGPFTGTRQEVAQRQAEG